MFPKLSKNFFLCFLSALNLTVHLFYIFQLTHEYPTSEHASDITHLLPFAENLISVDSKGVMCIFNIKTEGKSYD